MSSLHVDEAEPAWRYAVETDLVRLSPDQRPIETTTLLYDSNNRRLPFERSPTQSSIHHAFSQDERWFALAVGEDIDLYDLTNSERTILRGHTLEINCVAFVPGKSDTLVSSASLSWQDPRGKKNPEIFIWDLKETTARVGTEADSIQARDQADDLVRRVRTDFSADDPPTRLGRMEQDDVAKALEAFFSRVSNRSSARQIKGRLCSSFQSSLFNHAGTVLIILPGKDPRGFGRGRWDIALHNLGTNQVVTLKGHRESITWMSFTPDDRLIISASCDRTFKVWEPSSGECIWTWHTDLQNWTGAVSPDSQRFLGTDGAGIIRVWHLATGVLLWSYADHEEFGGRRRIVDWSADGRYVIAGGASFGRILVFDTLGAVIDGILQPIQSRVLSSERTILPPQQRLMVGQFLGLYSLRFIPTTDGEIVFGSATSLDMGVEIVSLTRGKRWRIIPFAEPQEGEARAEIPRSRHRGPAMHPAWTMLGKMGMLAVVSRSGVGFWKLD